MEEHDAAWEYCELGLVEVKEHKGVLRGGPDMRWSYDCHIRYYTVDGAVPRQLTIIDQQLPFNPFTKAMALLGAAGWELVSVQHGNAYGGTQPFASTALIGNNRVAYFKRPVVAGRAISEPELVI